MQMQGDGNESLEDSTNVSGIQHAENNTSPNPSTFDSFLNKLSALRNILTKDLRSADMKWSLFIAACQSYRYDSCLKPFPPQFIRNDTKDIDALREIVDMVPAFTILQRYLSEPDAYHINPQVIDLLFWVLVQYKDTQLISIPKTQFPFIMNQAGSETPVQPPNLIFEVKYNVLSVQESKWNHLALHKKTLYAYHGSRLENFHSILHHGLQQHMNKNSLFGRGIYLSSELAVSLPYSPMGYGWGRSRNGGQMSVIALCEMIDHPDVKCQTEESDKQRAITSDSIGGEVPKKYFVVVNSDLVRVRYLLVYSKQINFQQEKSGSLLGWLGSHKLLTLIIGYLLLLICVGLSNNQNIIRHFRRWLHRTGYYDRRS